MGCCNSASSKVKPYGQTLEGHKNEIENNGRPIDETHGHSVISSTEHVKRKGSNFRDQENYQQDETENRTNKHENRNNQREKENRKNKRDILTDEKTRGKIAMRECLIQSCFFFFLFFFLLEMHLH
jgi:hypothetical protein